MRRRPKSGDEIEVPVSAQERERILPAECGDPQVIGRNGLTFLFQLQANGCIGVRGVIVDVEHSHRSGPFPEPVLIAYPVPGLRDAKPVFTQDNRRNRQTLGPGDDFESRRFAFCGGR